MPQPGQISPPRARADGASNGSRNQRVAQLVAEARARRGGGRKGMKPFPVPGGKAPTLPLPIGKGQPGLSPILKRALGQQGSGPQRRRRRGAAGGGY